MPQPQTETAPMHTVPDARGHFGEFGGVYVPETLVAALEELAHTYQQAQADPAFWAELDHLNRTFVGRATPLYEATRLTEHARSLSQSGGGATIWLKREDLADRKSVV